MMALRRASLPSQQGQFARKPMICVLTAVVLTAGFWAGLIWAAERLYG